MLYDIIVYHDRCSDGTACKWIIKKYSKPTVKYIPVVSGQIHTIDVEDFNNKTVIFADIVPTIEQFNYMIHNCKFLTVIDHHLSSLNVFQDYLNREKTAVKIVSPKYSIRIDMTKSACQLVWDYFHLKLERPWMINYIGDRDLYKFELEFSKEINAAMFNLNLINMSGLDAMLKYTDPDFCELLEKGSEYLTKERKKCIECTKLAIKSLLHVNDKTYNIWSLNCPSELRSSVGNYLCETNFSDHTSPDFTLLWRLNPENTEYWISLRGIGKYDLDSIAKELDPGGGGHFDAAGLTLNKSDFLKFVNDI